MKYGPYDSPADALDAVQELLEVHLRNLWIVRRHAPRATRAYIRRNVGQLRALRACRVQATYGREYP